jgi:hypothetical protein
VTTVAGDVFDAEHETPAAGGEFLAVSPRVASRLHALLA